MGLNLLGRIYCYANKDQQACSTEVKRDVKLLNEQSRQDANNTEIETAQNVDSIQNVPNEICSAFSSSDSWNKSARFL